MGIEFTDEQLDVINIRKSNVLVSAAAGSGKTAVLVERIIEMILDEENGTDIDKLLVVTFTEAAAGEMKDRIRKAIEDQILKQPDNMHLQRQAALVHKARISTIHGFCLEVIRNYFNIIGLDPSFRIADENELRMMEEDVLDEIMEKHYANDDADFKYLVDCLSRGGDDREIREYVHNVYNFAQGYPWPEQWLDRCTQQYNISNVTEFNNAEWVKYLLQNVSLRVEDAKAMVLKAIEIADSPGGPKPYKKTLESDLNKLNELGAFSSYDDLYDILETFKFDTLSGKLNDDVFEEKKVAVKNIRDNYKAIIMGKSNAESVKNLIFCTSEEEILKMGVIKGQIETLTKLVNEFSVEYENRRRRKGVISFNDMEHYALNILCTVEGDEIFPSYAAKEYQASIDEILMDEYQDCNRVQDMIIRCVSREDSDEINNRFMVGDVKQSIYKFRLANPELFIEKYNSYSDIDRSGQRDFEYTRINLHKNFRSREEVINTVNNLFGQIMNTDVGGVAYDEDEYLVKGASYETDGNYESECILAVKSEENDTVKSELEAKMIAGKIKELRKTLMVTDKRTGNVRPLMYKDIVILVRSMTDVAKGIKEIFAKEGIPAVISLSNGFYQTKEIQQVLHFLKIIDNPRQDIPMYGAMTGYFGKFTDEEAARIKVDYLKTREKSKIHEKDYCLYDCLKVESELGKDDKVRDFLELIEEFRIKSSYTPIHQIISDLIGERTGYADYMSAMSMGEQRKANLNMLVLKAKDFESTSYRGLFNFNRYIEKIKKYGNDVGEAEIIDENANVVKVMTIHKSKGLEFPVCILAGTHKKFNTMDISKTMSIDVDYGMGLSYIDTIKRIKSMTLFLSTINLKIKQDLLGEELRVLYVALTRAREKLIVSGVIDDEENCRSKALERFLIDNDGRMIFSEKINCRSYLDFMSQMIAETTFVSSSDLDSEDNIEVLENADVKGELINLIAECREDDEIYKDFERRFSEKYPHPELEGLILKTSVSDIKKAYLDTEFTRELFKIDNDKDYIPRFIEDKADDISGTERGNAYHKIMELLDMNDMNVKSQINNMLIKERISQQYAKAVEVGKIEKFLRTPLGARMATAQKHGLLKREQPFVLGLGANVVDKKFPDTEMVLLQGIIDAFFVEDGKIVLVDYKTDVIKNKEELLKRYRIQLDYYVEALERITGYEVSESVLYSFCLGQEVRYR